MQTVFCECKQETSVMPTLIRSVGVSAVITNYKKPISGISLVFSKVGKKKKYNFKSGLDVNFFLYQYQLGSLRFLFKGHAALQTKMQFVSTDFKVIRKQCKLLF